MTANWSGCAFTISVLDSGAGNETRKWVEGLEICTQETAIHLKL